MKIPGLNLIRTLVPFLLQIITAWGQADVHLPGALVPASGGCSTCGGVDKVATDCPACVCPACSGRRLARCTVCRGFREMQCPTCRGAKFGPDEEKWVACVRCGGDGAVDAPVFERVGGGAMRRSSTYVSGYVAATCPLCNGKGGKEQQKRTYCPTCAGRGATDCATCQGTGVCKCARCGQQVILSPCPICNGTRRTLVSCPACLSAKGQNVPSRPAGEATAVQTAPAFTNRARTLAESRESSSGLRSTPASVVCPACRGRAVVPCATCGGQIAVKCPTCLGSQFGPDVTARKRCTSCGGRGRGSLRYPYAAAICPNCYGAGFNEERERTYCKTCEGRGTVRCSACGGSKLMKCIACEGKGMH